MSAKLGEIAEEHAAKILKLEGIADEEDGCSHTPDGDGTTCSRCREARYVLVIRAALTEAYDLGRAERDKELREITAEWDGYNGDNIVAGLRIALDAREGEQES
jgi:hypothetical protein